MPDEDVGEESEDSDKVSVPDVGAGDGRLDVDELRGEQVRAFLGDEVGRTGSRSEEVRFVAEGIVRD